ncbi:MAG TPA: riboflavin synthase [Luteibaculaceae bacterium]|nr:riboflavin synthase [Luteibaculaceae bacterium]
MFTGIIESLGVLVDLQHEASNLHLTFESNISNELKIDQSVAHNGVCLTVVQCGNGRHTVTAIDETLQKTNLGQLKLGHRVNLERCLVAGGRLDGHIVQGHVDQIGKCVNVVDQNGSWRYDFEYDPTLGNITVEKGSICVNGVSLTVVNSVPNGFSVAIIPYTWENTGFGQLHAGDSVNLEFDIVGKYIKRLHQGYGWKS